MDRTPASETTEVINLTPLVNSRPEEWTQVCARAQEIYAATFGCTRPHRCSTRLDKGIKRKSRRVHGSEADWLRRRRLAVKDATQDRLGATDGTLRSQGTIMCIDDDGGTLRAQGTIFGNADAARPAQWCAAHEKELQYQMRKKQARLVEAFRDGVLLQHEEGDAAILLDIKVEKDEEADRRHLQTERRVQRKFGMLHRDLDWQQLANIKAWCLPSKPSTTTANISEALAKKGVNTTLDKMEARLFVVDNLEQPGERIQWLVALHGGWLVTVSRVLVNKEHS